MKKLESNSISEAFGIHSMEIDELYSINGGSSVTTGISSISIGTCINIGSIGPQIPILTGMYPGPSKPIIRTTISISAIK